MRKYLFLILTLFLFVGTSPVLAETYQRENENTLVLDKDKALSQTERDTLDEYNLRMSNGTPKLQLAFIIDRDRSTKPTEKEFQEVYSSWHLGEKYTSNYGILLQAKDTIYVYFSDELKAGLPENIVKEYEAGVKEPIESVVKDIRFNQVITYDSNTKELKVTKDQKLSNSFKVGGIIVFIGAIGAFALTMVISSIERSKVEEQELVNETIQQEETNEIEQEEVSEVELEEKPKTTKKRRIGRSTKNKRRT